MVLLDLVNPFPFTSLTLNHFEKQGYRGSGAAALFPRGSGRAIRDSEGMDGKTHGTPAIWRTGSPIAIEK